MKLELQATPEEVMRAVEALETYGRERGLVETTLFGLTLALEECGSNIVNHALRRDANRTFQVSFESTETELVIELRDPGPPFDPTHMPDRAPSLEDENEPPGGWGIQLVRRYTDDIHYTRDGEENVLRLIKRLDPPSLQD